MITPKGCSHMFLAHSGKYWVTVQRLIGTKLDIEEFWKYGKC